MSSVDPEDYANQLDGGQEGACELVVASCNGAKVFEFVEESFDKVALAIQGEVRVSRFDAVGLGRNDRRDSPLIEGVDQRAGIIGFVSQECLGFNLVEQRLGLTDVGRLAGSE